MNVLTKAVSEIKFVIPREVLRIAFLDDGMFKKSIIVNIDERITNSVLRSRVLVDCNLVGGMERSINLSTATVIHTEGYHTVYRIPKRLLDNKTIMSVLSFLPGVLPDAGGTSYGTGSGSSISDLSSMAMSGDGFSAPLSANDIELVGDNTVLVKYRQYPEVPGALRVSLANDENLNNIHPRAYPSFARLAVLAVKSYIYNTLVIKLDKAYIYGGQELGTITEYVNNLSDIEELYQEELHNVWRKVALMNDSESSTRLIRSLIPNVL